MLAQRVSSVVRPRRFSRLVPTNTALKKNNTRVVVAASSRRFHSSSCDAIGYAGTTDKKIGQDEGTFMRATALACALAGASFIESTRRDRTNVVKCEVSGAIGKTNWDNVRNDIIDLLEDEQYMEEPVGPLLVRLAWHSSGTWCAKLKTGGSDGATMRFSPESKWGANAGLDRARKLLEPLCKKYSNATTSDMWIFAGTVALEEMSGNKIKIGFKEGRQDKPENSCPAWETKTAPQGRLPSADMGDMKATANHLRTIFNRQGFSDQEIVALSGAHALGRCHESSSGYWGPWTYAPTVLSNEYFRLLVDEKWTIKKTHNGKAWTGPQQYETPNGELMMLPSDICLLHDASFKKYVDQYAKDEGKFLKDFTNVVKRLFENGVPFKERHGFGYLSGAFCSVPEVGGAK